MLRYFSETMFRLVPCPVSMSLFRLFNAFIPYTLRHNLEQGGELIYYHGPHELCIIAGGPQNQLILS